ncbi:protein TonB [Methylopila capsulata]|uniref:Protein TonB n=1 Tax=Methylopila capsulata TaxID=61654 RepID=A0A9W6MQW1_9HYPH|nr:TonB family protein [Methylopila capsulata]MBM7851377.1 protein TonB [Methylopila capsulata]GLK54434.1 hypothetical protein GCM10008170_04530 [Methylopila capsulata]
MAGAEALTLTAAQDRPGVARWALAGVAVLAVHAAAGLLLRDAEPPAGFQAPPAIEMDLVPPPAGATNPEVAAQMTDAETPETVNEEQETEELPEMTAEETPTPPDPEAVTAEDEPETVQELTEPQELAETRPDVTPTVALPPEETVTAREETPESKVVRKPAPAKKKPEPARPARKPPAAPPPQTAGGARGVSSTSGAAASAAASTYAKQVAALLAASKRYPPSLISQKVSGRGQVTFTLNRSGSVVSASVTSSAGHQLLDAELQAMVRRANFPPMPADMPGASKRFTIPVSFSVR